MKTLTNNIENFKKDASEFFGGSSIINFKYQVATNLGLYQTDNVEYAPNDFRISLFNLVVNNPYTQLTEVFSEYYDKSMSQHIKEQVKATVHFTASEAGSVKVGNDDFTILIPNRYGDGTTEVIITEGEAHVPFEFFTTIQGSFYLYNFDCGDCDIQTTLNGRYSIYSKDQTVVFEKTN